MPIYEYVCPVGHITERIIRITALNEPKKFSKCCHLACALKATLQASLTGKPILKKGCGGFYKPNA